MIVKFINERMTFLPTPKNLQEFIDVIGEEYGLAGVRSLFQYFLHKSMKGTFRFMGGHGWFFFFAVTQDNEFGYIKSEITAGRILDDRWSFSAIGSEMLDHTEENSKVLKKKLMAAEKLLSSCSSVDDLFTEFEKMKDKIYLLPTK